MRGVQNGLIALGAFIALAQDVNGWLVFGFCLLCWWREEDFGKKE